VPAKRVRRRKTGPHPIAVNVDPTYLHEVTHALI
jgi:hypothetical protein